VPPADVAGARRRREQGAAGTAAGHPARAARRTRGAGRGAAPRRRRIRRLGALLLWGLLTAPIFFFLRAIYALLHLVAVHVPEIHALTMEFSLSPPSHSSPHCLWKGIRPCRASGRLSKLFAARPGNSRRRTTPQRGRGSTPVQRAWHFGSDLLHFFQSSRLAHIFRQKKKINIFRSCTAPQRTVRVQRHCGLCHFWMNSAPCSMDRRRRASARAASGYVSRAWPRHFVSIFKMSHNTIFLNLQQSRYDVTSLGNLEALAETERGLATAARLQKAK
jgi:hypothetical protein